METVLLIIGIVIVILALILLVLLLKISKNCGAGGNDSSEIRLLIDTFKNDSSSANRELREELSSNMQTSVRNLGDMLNASQRSAGENQSAKIADMGTQIFRRLEGCTLYIKNRHCV